MTGLIEGTAQASTTEAAPGSQPAAETAAAAAAAAAAAPAAQPDTGQAAPAAGEKPAGEAGKAEGEGGEKPAGEQAAAAEGAKPEGAKTDDAPQGAPEVYADFIVPEGVALNPELMTELGTIAKELNLPQAEAQKLVDLGAKQAQAFATSIGDIVTKTNADYVAKAKVDWAQEAKADTEIGGDKLPASLSSARQVLTTFGSAKLNELLDQTGLGNHPEFIRLFAKVGAAISEDTLVPPGGNGGGGPVDAAARLYPDQK